MENVKQENFPTTFYISQLEKLAKEHTKYSQKSKLWVLIRLSTFIGIALLFYFTFPYNILSTLSIIASIVLFLFFVRKSAENKEHLNYLKQLIAFNENEIKASQHDFSAFPDGAAYIQPDHPFSYDMDVFGNRSFFQLFNRTVTIKGERRLAERLLNGVKDPIESAKAIDELTTHKEWYQGFLAHGKSLEKEETDVSIAQVVNEDFSSKSWIKFARIIIPILAISLTTAMYFDIVSGIQFIVIAAILMLPTRQTLKTTNSLHSSLSKIGKRANAMSKQLLLIEEKSFSSNLLKRYHEELFTENSNAKQGLKELSLLVKEAEYRDNVIVAVFLNFFFAWDFRLLLKIKTWQEKYALQAERWEEIVYDFEGLISGANFRVNFQEHTSAPTLTSADDLEISLVNLGHPIIPLSKLVKNSFSLNGQEQFAIITGPNMAGKSTFLRSIGINLMLAKAGFHVMAEKFTFPDMQLYSSMRTSDDLKDETSYFHAELLRLRFIMDAIENGEKVFIILDEILKGTNSKDKEEGSSKFLQKLNKLNVKGIIATHDLSLTDLANEYPSIVNRYFDTDIKGDEISFDYCIHNGVAKNMNASFLLRKMGLIDN